MNKSALILAAGQGTRIKSNKPKVLHKVCGKEMVNHVIDTMRQASIEDVNVIIGKGADLVKEFTSTRNVSYSLQEEQLGTGHAVKCAKDFLNGKKGVVVIFTGDAPLITPETVSNLISTHIENENSATLLTSIMDNPAGYGRVFRDVNGCVEKIVEHKDCSLEQLNNKEINAGMYCFDIESLLLSLDKLSNNNSQGEYYLTDVIEILTSANKKIGAMIIDFEETIGVNSRAELAKAEEVLRRRINLKHMNNGVTLIDPSTTYIGCDVEIGQDTIIYPNNVLEGTTKIGADCILYPNNRISNSVIKDNAVIQTSTILDSIVGRKTTVGPYAYVRPESSIGDNVRIGDFVEIKKSKIDDNTKVSHLSYIGDAEVGANCNFGCGTVIVNYDGKAKHKTVVGDNVFVGCNSNLVSPVNINNNSYIAAGSTITEDVPSNSFSIARAYQVNKENYLKK